MPTFKIQAYQEMFTNLTIEAANPSEAVKQFKLMVKDGTVTWEPSDEDLEISVDGIEPDATATEDVE
jgi:hypothetical protein